MCQVGLRVDVDTLRGTCVGVPRLLALLRNHKISATFFFSVGPDNMGRHAWRLLRPRFLAKMLRTNAAKLYGWDILLQGMFWPGPEIGKRCPAAIREAAEAGHEVGLHAWDHHRWQTKLTRMSQTAIADEIRQGYDALTTILGCAPTCFAAPAWMVTTDALAVLERFSFQFQSDCRGHSLFFPQMSRRLQVPTTLPTYDELIGRQCTLASYNDHLLEMIRADRLNILTIHAEVEGGACSELFQDFLGRAAARGIVFKPLGEMAAAAAGIKEAKIDTGTVAGRAGWLARQIKTEQNSH